MAEEQAPGAMSGEEPEAEGGPAADHSPTEQPPPWAELPAPALDATLAALNLQDRLSAAAACKSWLDASSESAALWGNLKLDEDSGVGGSSGRSGLGGLGGLFKALLKQPAEDTQPPHAPAADPEGTEAWFRRRAGAIHTLTFSTWDEECAERLAPLLPLALRGLGAAGGASAGGSAGAGTAARPRFSLSELEVSLEGCKPLDDCPQLLSGCTGLRSLTLTTASPMAMLSLPPSLTALKMHLVLPATKDLSPEVYLTLLTQAAIPLGRLAGLKQLDFKSNAAVHGALPVPFAPPQLTQLAVRQPSLSMLPPPVSDLSRLEKLDLIAELSWGGESGGGGGQGGQAEGEEGEQEQANEEDDSGPLIFRFVLPDQLDALSRLRSLRFYNCWFEELPEVVTALGSLEDLAIKNSRLGVFPEQQIDMSGLSRLTSLRFCACSFAHLPASLSALSALRQLALEVMPSSGGMGLMFGTSKRLTFAPQLSSLARLESLEFYGCCIRELPPAVAGMKGLRRIVVSGGAIEVHDRFFVQQPSALGLNIPGSLLLGLENLEEVILRSCGFQGPRAAIHLPPSVKRVAVTGAHKLEWVDFGPHATGLEEVNLLGTNLPSVEPSLAAAASSLRTLSMTGLDAEHPITQEDVSALLPLAELVKSSAATAGTRAECIAEDEDLGPATAFFTEASPEEQCAIM